MKALHHVMDRFCARHPRFGVRNLMLYIVIGTAIVYVFSAMDTTRTFLSYLYFNPALVLRGQIWRLFTFVLVPTNGQLIWEVISLYFYYFIGSTLEKYWGAGRFTLYYLSGILLTILYGFLMFLFGFSGEFLESEYINLSMFFAFAMLFPDTRVLLFFFIPIKIKWLAYVDAAFFLLGVLQFYIFPANLLPLVAMLNFVLFCWPEISDIFRRNKASRSRATIHFRQEAQRIRHEQASTPYRHKCAVCGRTDTDYPNLQFRYCSRCAGFHCFCEEHINSHIHFIE